LLNSCLREVTCSLAKTRLRCHSTVRGLRNIRAAPCLRDASFSAQRCPAQPRLAHSARPADDPSGVTLPLRRNTDRVAPTRQQLSPVDH
jgi:hypothetical protein